MTIVILAAGAARRMGRQKLLLPIDGQPMVLHVIAAAAAWPTTVVAGDDVATLLESCSEITLVRNREPERGMAHSLRLADRDIARDEPIAVLLGDVPDIGAAAIAETIAVYGPDVDVVDPRRAGLPAHPVVFGPRARRYIAGLPDGDTLRSLREHAALRRRTIEVAAPVPHDIDTPAAYADRIARTERSGE